MDVVISVTTAAGSGATFSVQEQISGLGYIETCNSGTISTNGTFFLVASDKGAQGTSATILSLSPTMGKFGQKQVVVKQAGTVSTLACTVYLLPFTN